MNIPIEFIVDVDNSYSRNSLETFYRKFLLHFILKNEDSLKKQGIKLDILVKKKLVKEDFVFLFSQIIYDEEIFLRLLYSLPKTIKEVFQSLLFEGMKEYKELKKMFPKLEDHLKVFGNQVIIEPECLILSHTIQDNYSYGWSNRTKEIHLFIPSVLRKHWLSIIPVPDEYKLIPVDSPFLHHLVFNAEEEIIVNLPLYIAYYLQGDIKYTASEKVQAGSLNKMKKACNIREFYDIGEKELLNIRTTFIADFLPLIKKKNPPNPEDVPAVLVQAMNSLISEQRISPIFHWLRHIKGSAYVKNYYENLLIIPQMLRMIQNIPPGEWFSFLNFQKNLQLNFPKLEPVSPKTANHYLYLEVEGKYGNDQLYITPAHYDQVIRQPLIKAFCFFLSSLGLMEIAYDFPPDEPLGINQRNRDYLSPYDGLQFIKINDLGAYVLGLKKDYQVPELEKNYSLELHTEYLMISYSGENKILEMYLENIAYKSGEKRYKVDYTSFLKDCKNQKDIQNKIEQFKKLIEKDPPAIWQQFFNELIEKYNPVYKVNDYSIFKILPQNKALASIIAKDEILKKIIIKAEDFHFMVQEKDKSILKSRLASHGYLLP